MNGTVSTWNICEYTPQGNPPSFNYDQKNFLSESKCLCVSFGNGQILGPYFLRETTFCRI